MQGFKRSKIEMVHNRVLWLDKLGSTHTHKTIDCAPSAPHSILRPTRSSPCSEVSLLVLPSFSTQVRGISISHQVCSCWSQLFTQADKDPTRTDVTAEISQLLRPRPPPPFPFPSSIVADVQQASSQSSPVLRQSASVASRNTDLSKRCTTATQRTEECRATSWQKRP